MENELLQRYAHPFFTRDQVDALMDYFGLEDHDLLEPFLDRENMMEESDYAFGIVGRMNEKKTDVYRFSRRQLQ
jgi:hypothetical protein